MHAHSSDKTGLEASKEPSDRHLRTTRSLERSLSPAGPSSEFTRPTAGHGRARCHEFDRYATSTKRSGLHEYSRGARHAHMDRNSSITSGQDSRTSSSLITRVRGQPTSPSQLQQIGVGLRRALVAVRLLGVGLTLSFFALIIRKALQLEEQNAEGMVVYLSCIALGIIINGLLNLTWAVLTWRQQEDTCPCSQNLKPYTCQLVWDVFFSVLWLAMLGCNFIYRKRWYFFLGGGLGALWPWVCIGIIWRLRVLVGTEEAQRGGQVLVVVQRMGQGRGGKVYRAPPTAHLV